MGANVAGAAPLPDGLLASLKRGDRAAFQTLARMQAGMMLALAQRLLGNEDEARRAVLEGFGATEQALARLADEPALAACLQRLVIRACLASLRARPRGAGAAIEPLLPRFHDDGHHAEHPADWSAEPPPDPGQRRALVRDCIDRLPEEHRAVLVLHDVLGLGLAEVGLALELDHDAAKRRLHQARQALRGLLAERLQRSPA